VDDALVQRAAELGDIWLRSKRDGKSRGAESAMRAMPTGFYEFVARVSAERTGHARLLYAEQPRRAVIVASTLPIFPVLLSQSRHGCG